MATKSKKANDVTSEDERPDMRTDAWVSSFQLASATVEEFTLALERSGRLNLHQKVALRAKSRAAQYRLGVMELALLEAGEASG